MGYTMTNHSSHKKGSAKHNDRTYEGADREKAQGNIYRQLNEGMSFEENERLEYERRFRPFLDAYNEKQIAQRHPERCKTMDDLYESKRTGPEEIIHEVGNASASIEPELLRKAYNEYLAWHRAEWPGVIILDSALHLDEKTPHFHTRQVWTYTDEKDGLLKIGQDKCLQQKGVALPDETKERGQHNNRKQVYTAMCRENLIEIYKGLGIEIEQAESRTKHEQNLDKDEFIDMKYRRYGEAVKEQEATIEQNKASIKRQEAQIDRLEGRTTELRQEALEKAGKGLFGRPKKAVKVPAEEYAHLIKRASLNEDLKEQEQRNQEQERRNRDEARRLESRHEELDRLFEEQKRGATAEEKRLRAFLQEIKFSDGKSVLDVFREKEEARKQELRERQSHHIHR